MGITTFTDKSPPWSLTALDQNFSYLQSLNAINVKDYGAVGDGSTDDTAAIAAAVAASAGKTLVFDGKYLISSTITISNKMFLLFRGSHGLTPDTYLLKKSTMSGPALKIAADGTEGFGVSVLGQVGNAGDGILIHADSVTLYSPCARLCGQDGIRIGDDANTGVHFNAFTLYSPTCWNNVRHGIYIEDGTPAFNTNAGTIIRPSCENNGGDGLKITHGEWNSIIGHVLEANTGWGLNLQTNATNNFVLGGDAETNAAGNIQNLGFGNTILIQESFTSRNMTLQGTFAVNGAASLNLGNSTNPSTTNAAAYFVGAAASNANWAGLYFSGATNTDNFVGMVPNSVSGTTDAFGFVTVSGGTPTLRAMYSSLGFKFFSPMIRSRSAPAYSASITINALAGNQFEITATNGTAFTINAPTTPQDGQRITIMIKNASGGALGVITWNAVFKMIAFTSPTNGNNCSVDFCYNGTNWVQITAQSLQIPN